MLSFLGLPSPSSLGPQLVKNPPAVQETQVRPLGQEDPLEKGMATHYSLAWEMPWTEEPGGVFSNESTLRMRWPKYTISLYKF